MKTTVLVGPRDVLIAVGRMLANHGAWLSVIGLPIFYLLDMRRPRQEAAVPGSNTGWNAPDDGD